MASIFTYDPDPPRVSSPWLSADTSTPDAVHDTIPVERPGLGNGKPTSSPRPSLLSECGITKLEAEPQKGPTEYKLHLLLRPRRSFSASSTGQHISGSYHSRLHGAVPLTQSALHHSSPARVSTPSNQSRQNRLQQLTTQLLWRLQQSSPYHGSSTSDLVLPNLPEATPVLETPTRPVRPLPGLEESRGALYEIGVSDDGTLVGLTKDEMDESLNNLDAMAGSLGCRVVVLRMVVVGDCEWIGDSLSPSSVEQKTYAGKLWVAEALVKPDVNHCTHVNLKAPLCSSTTFPPEHDQVLMEEVRSNTEQLRVSLIGATTSGKSSLLGTLLTATLDNGRGKSRLSLLKHRHEMVSGQTSSVTQELIGYRPVDANSAQHAKVIEVINYASGNVSSWNDIHSASEAERLVFLSDSAGHPRFRRTTVRGLVGWAPHWTFLCVAGGSDDDSNMIRTSAQDITTASTSAFNLSHAHLELCLKLRVPLVIVMTKLDLASKVGLRQNLAKILTTLKARGRKPLMLPTTSISTEMDPRVQCITEDDEVEVKKALNEIRQDDHGFIVPILFTSAVGGTGIGKMHALLHHLPIPSAGLPRRLSADVAQEASTFPCVLFHIEDIYNTPIPNENPHQSSSENTEVTTFVLSGHLRYGELSIGDQLVLGPCPIAAAPPSGTDWLHRRSSFNTPSNLFSSVLQPQSTSDKFQSPTFENDASLSPSDLEWRRVRVVSVRNLRLPVRTLSAGQVGTIGVILQQSVPQGSFPLSSDNSKSQKIIDLPRSSPTDPPRIRKGMIITRPAEKLSASDGFVGVFNETDLSSVSLGSLVVVYIASVRASARIVSLCLTDTRRSGEASLQDGHSVNTLGSDIVSSDVQHDSSGADAPEMNQSQQTTATAEVTFRFMTYREWIELGSQVLIMPGGGPGLYGGSERGEKGVGGLEGFVGSVVGVF